MYNLPTNPEIRALIDTATLARIHETRGEHVPTLACARQDARRHLMNDTHIRSITMYVVRACGALELIEFTADTFRTVWHFGKLDGSSRTF